MEFFFKISKNRGLGIGDWGLGIGDWAKVAIHKPQLPIPNPPNKLLNFFPKKIIIKIQIKH